MLKKRGLALKTFVFTFTVITLVVAVSFGILYFMLPGYYLRQKNSTLKKNSDVLETSLNNAKSVDECAELILRFANSNNSEVIAFDSRDMFIPEMSSPFLLINASDRQSVKFNVVYTEKIFDNGGDFLERSVTQRLISGSGANDDIWEGGSHYTDFAVGGKSLVLKHDLSSVFVTKHLNSDLLGYITITNTLQPIDEAKSVLISLMPYLMALNFVIALVAAYIFSDRLTKPMLKISNAAAMMHDMKPGALSGVRTGDELGELSRNLDGMYLNLCENIENLKRERDKAAGLEQSKTDFMRAAGHELKTPIASLNCVIEGMIDNVGPYKNHEKYLLESKGQIASLSRLVNEILATSRLDDVVSDIERRDVNINGIVEDAVGMYEALIERKGIQIERKKFEFIYGTDEQILRTVLSNLISNAVNYTEPGGKISVSFDSGDNILSVENQCDPIDDELLPRLFEPFFTLNYSRNRSKSGTGLGLYIVKKNLDALKLSFKMENTKTENTVSGIKFSIVFP